MTTHTGRVICNITISADGYSAGLNPTEERPFRGDGGDGWATSCTPGSPRPSPSIAGAPGLLLSLVRAWVARAVVPRAARALRRSRSPHSGDRDSPGLVDALTAGEGEVLTLLVEGATITSAPSSAARNCTAAMNRWSGA